MLRRFNLGRAGLWVLGAAVALSFAAPQKSDAAAISPANLDRPVSMTVISPRTLQTVLPLHQALSPLRAHLPSLSERALAAQICERRRQQRFLRKPRFM